MFEYFRGLLNGQYEPLILLYHRIAKTEPDPWGLALSPDYFAEHLRIIGRSRTPLPMTEFVWALRNGKLPRNAIALTFDDGYRDTLTCAKPLLDHAGISATVFLTTGSLGMRCEFWWDELARLVLGAGVRVNGLVEIAGERLSFDLPPVSEEETCSHWRVWEEPKNARQICYLKLWKAMMTLDRLSRETAMRRVRQMFGERPIDGQPMSIEDVAAVLRGSTFAVGAHSVSHRQLTATPLADRRAEVVESKHVCEKLTGQRVEGFAYPYGEVDQATKDLVEECGFEWACTTREQAIDSRCQDLFSLPRIQCRKSVLPLSVHDHCYSS